jgi:hypothetical protein
VVGTIQQNPGKWGRGLVCCKSSLVMLLLGGLQRSDMDNVSARKPRLWRVTTAEDEEDDEEKIRKVVVAIWGAFVIRLCPDVHISDS